MAKVPANPKPMTKLERRIHNEKVLLHARWRSAASISLMLAAALAVAVGLGPLEVQYSLNWWITMLIGIGCVVIGRYVQRLALSDLDKLLDD